MNTTTNLVSDRQTRLLAEADNERLASVARAHARSARPTASQARPRARRSVVRRLVDRLAMA